MWAKFEPTEIKIRLNLWDTVGTERYAAMNRQYFSDSACAIIVYDITDADSLFDVSKWLRFVEQYCPKTTLKILVGNKIDLFTERVVTGAEAKRFAEENDLDALYEVSAREATGVAEMLGDVAQDISDLATSHVSHHLSYLSHALNWSLFRLCNRGKRWPESTKCSGCSRRKRNRSLPISSLGARFAHFFSTIECGETNQLKRDPESG